MDVIHGRASCVSMVAGRGDDSSEEGLDEQFGQHRRLVEGMLGFHT